MRVAVNLLWCLPGQVGGSEEYVTRALGAVASEPGAPQLLLFVPDGFVAAHGALASTATRVETSPASGRLRPVRVAVERTWLRRRVHHAGPDVVHHAGGTAPFGRRDRHPRTVVSVHDIQFVSHPEHFSAVKRRWLAAQTPRAVHRAEVVTVPTAWVGRTLVEHFDADPDRIHVVPHGPPSEVTVSGDAITRVRRQYRLPGPYLIFPAVTYPHKNHVVLLEAMDALRPQHPDLRLVLTGGEGRAEAEVAAGIARRDLGDVVRRTGRVPARDRDALLAGASLLVFPSRYEGFGAPVVEAMAAGVPVVAASTTALPEVVGDAARLVDPDDVTGWVDAIEHLLADDGARAELIVAGRRRAAAFTPRRTATALSGAYRAALDRDT
jgi:alpha-1,3-rhamnosyl/mannosyltransferase